MSAPCPLCNAENETVLWRDDLARAILVADAKYPAFCRVILNRHVKEMTDLAPEARAQLMRIVFAVEAALRSVLVPDKINLASLGNQVPHLHWHVIPRFEDDAHFPDPLWAAAKRPGVSHGVDAATLASAIAAQFER
ncbi:MAG: HIT family protein [Gammaproteobacteria bacterium]|nr:HIT family protein [Gammaproteobacteria bacterium]